MNRAVAVLLLLFVIQCGIVAAVHRSGQGPAPNSVREAIASFPLAAAEVIHIGDQFDNEVVLTKSGGLWLLPDLGDLPADQGKVGQLLRGLASGDGRWPVARSTAARQRFQVADYYYQRRLTLEGGGAGRDVIYLGTSPGFRKVHARNEARDDIYSIDFNNFDAPAISGGWLEPRLLQIRSPLWIDAQSYTLSFDNGVWRSVSGGVPDERELEALLTTLRSIQVDGVADRDLQRELSEAEAELVLTVRGLAGEVTLEVFAVADEHFIHSSEYPLFFKLSAYDFDRLTGIDFGLISGDASGN